MNWLQSWVKPTEFLLLAQQICAWLLLMITVTLPYSVIIAPFREKKKIGGEGGKAHVYCWLSCFAATETQAWKKRWCCKVSKGRPLWPYFSISFLGSVKWAAQFGYPIFLASFCFKVMLTFWNVLCLGFCQYCLGPSLVFLGGLFYLSLYLILEFGITSGGTWGLVLFLCSRVIRRELRGHGPKGSDIVSCLQNMCSTLRTIFMTLYFICNVLSIRGA